MPTVKRIWNRLLPFRQMPGQLPPRRGLVVHALHKSASMFLFRLFDELCRRLNVPLYSIHNQPADHDRVPHEIAHGFVLGPLRNFATSRLDFPNLDTVHHLLQIRDPRDILVSEYFSLGWIHDDAAWSDEEKQRRQQIRQLSIDDFVLQEGEFNRVPLIDRYRPIEQWLGQPHATIVRYEDMVLDFGSWLRSVLEAWQLEPARQWQRRLARQYRNEFRPQPNSHKRNILPGDHRRKLKPETIQILNQRFDCILSPLGYHRDVRAA